MKKHILEIIWVITILVVVGQIVYFTNREKLPEGMIILEESGDRNSVHLARSLNQKYLPSTAKSLQARPKIQSQPELPEKTVPQTQNETAAIVKKVKTEDQLKHDFATLPATRLRLSRNGEFEQVSSALETDLQVIESLAIEAEPLKHLKTSDIDEVTENSAQPLN